MTWNEYIDCVIQKTEGNFLRKEPFNLCFTNDFVSMMIDRNTAEHHLKLITCIDNMERPKSRYIFDYPQTGEIFDRKKHLKPRINFLDNLKTKEL